jgi:flagellar basal-body rod protein FlgF
VDAGIYLSAAGALAAEARLDVVANNIANVETPGFKRSFTLVRERPPEAASAGIRGRGRPDLDALGGGPIVQEIRFDASRGGLRSTGESLDVAIDGDGWFSVDRDGEVLHTRAGNFVRTPDGRLATADGRGFVLDDGGSPIELPAIGSIDIGEDGTIAVGGETVARLGVVGSLDPDQFQPAGGTLFRRIGPGAAEEAEGFRIRQGMLETSTAEPVREMVRMIHTFRAYETNQRMIALQDESLGRAVRDVGRLV